jgi:hypothetical protein
MNPGSAILPVITFTATVAGDVDSFNQTAYTQSLARMLTGVSASDISVTVAAASVSVTASIVASTTEVGDSALSVLSASDAATLSAALGVTVTAVATPALALVPVAASQLPRLPSPLTGIEPLPPPPPSPMDPEPMPPPPPAPLPPEPSPPTGIVAGAGAVAALMSGGEVTTSGEGLLSVVYALAIVIAVMLASALAFVCIQCVRSTKHKRSKSSRSRTDPSAVVGHTVNVMASEVALVGVSNQWTNLSGGGSSEQESPRTPNVPDLPFPQVQATELPCGDDDTRSTPFVPSIDAADIDAADFDVSRDISPRQVASSPRPFNPSPRASSGKTPDIGTGGSVPATLAFV